MNMINSSMDITATRVGRITKHSFLPGIAASTCEKIDCAELAYGTFAELSMLVAGSKLLDGYRSGYRTYKPLIWGGADRKQTRT